MNWQIHQFDNDQMLVDELAPLLAQKLQLAIALNGEATLAVSGGSTPKKLFERLSRQPIIWDRVIVTLVDERWLDETDENSNAYLVKRYLLQNRAKHARFLSLKSNSPTPFDGEAEINQRLENLPASIDVLILGMGSDGHTASFFPEAATLSMALATTNSKKVCAVTPPHAAYDRMTLTLATILKSKHLFLHIVGEEKWCVLQSAMQIGNIEELPIRAVLHQADTSLEIYYANNA